MQGKIVLSEQQIRDFSVTLGKQITEEIKNDEKPALVVGVLKGATPFMMDLVKNITCPIYMDFIHVVSYDGTSSTGKVQLRKDTSFDCEGRTVIIVEDVIDSGASFAFLKKHFEANNPKRILTCVMVDKKFARKVPFEVDYAGYTMHNDAFLVGYGLDYNELGRNLPYIFEATPEDVAEMDKINKK